jgi:hypothetical protein
MREGGGCVYAFDISTGVYKAWMAWDDTLSHSLVASNQAPGPANLASR